MDLIHSLILGVVEGLTEFLPISSTAHLSLTAHIFGIDQSAIVKSFEIAIQSGAIFAVIVIYWKKFINLDILKKLFIAFVPTGIIGLEFYKVAKTYLIGNMAVIIWALGIGGIILIIFEKFITKKVSQSSGEIVESGKVTGQIDINSLSYPKALIIGLVQSLAIIPGVSRSAATIIGGRLLGMSREAVVEFSFLLAVPTILAATGYDLIKNFSLFTAHDAGSLALGFVAAFVTAIFAVKWLLSYIQKRSFVSFGVYRIIIALIFGVIVYGSVFLK